MVFITIGFEEVNFLSSLDVLHTSLVDCINFIFVLLGFQAIFYPRGATIIYAMCIGFVFNEALFVAEQYSLVPMLIGEMNIVAYPIFLISLLSIKKINSLRQKSNEG